LDPRLLRCERRAAPLAHLHKRASTLIKLAFDLPLATTGDRSLPPVLARQWHARRTLAPYRSLRHPPNLSRKPAGSADRKGAAQAVVHHLGRQDLATDRHSAPSGPAVIECGKLILASRKVETCPLTGSLRVPSRARTVHDRCCRPRCTWKHPRTTRP